MVILRSILIICAISGISSAIFYPVFGFDYVKTFVATTAIQLVIGVIVATIRDALTVTRIKELQIQEISEYGKQGMELKCASCGKLSYVPIRFDEHNTYDCPHCNSANAVYLNITVARETTMLNKKPISTSSVNDDESIAIKSIKS